VAVNYIILNRTVNTVLSILFHFLHATRSYHKEGIEQFNSPASFWVVIPCSVVVGLGIGTSLWTR